MGQRSSCSSSAKASSARPIIDDRFLSHKIQTDMSLIIRTHAAGSGLYSLLFILLLILAGSEDELLVAMRAGDSLAYLWWSGIALHPAALQVIFFIYDLVCGIQEDIISHKEVEGCAVNAQLVGSIYL